MRYLLDFVRAELSAFKFGITIVGNTALFTRMEGETRDRNPRRLIKGYRDVFENQYTKIPASAARTTSHHRVVKYDFADQTILLRYAVDAYLGDLAKLPMQSNSIEDIGLGPPVKQQKTTNMRGVPPSKILPSDTPVTVIGGGRHIPHAATLELTTRSQYSQALDSIEQKLPNFWISQTLNYLLCLHHESRDRSNRSTNFNHIRRISMGGLLSGWEQSNEERLRALAHVLRQIIRAAQELGGSCIVSSDGSQGSSLKVSKDEAEEVPALPKDMQSLFLPIKDETTDVPIKQEEVAMTATTASPDGTRKRKYGTEDAPEVTGLPPARRTALDSSFRTFGEVGTTPPATSTKVYEGTRKRKFDPEDASELTDSRISRRRALSPSFRTLGSGVVTAIKEEEPSVKVKDEAVDSEMEM